MSQSPFKTKKFEALKAKWYAKLEKSGFKDIEQDENNLKEWDSYAFCSRYNRHLFSSKEAYYQLAGQFLHTHNFKDKREQLIWECHSNGKSVTQIAEILKAKRFKIHNRTSVYLIMRGLAKEMLKKYGTDSND